MVKISIITVCKNEEKTIEQTVQSVLSQKNVDIEYIVIDGGSDDGTFDIIQKQNDRIDIIISEQDSGIYNAMNKGLSFATGEYVFFLNAGDSLYNKTVIEKVAIQVEQLQPDVLYGNIATKKNDAKYCGGEHLSTLTAWKLFFWSIPHPATFYKTRLLREQSGFDESFRIVSDYDIALKLFFSGAHFLYHNIVVSIFDQSGISSNTAFHVIHKKERRVVRERYFSGVKRVLVIFPLFEQLVRKLYKMVFM